MAKPNEVQSPEFNKIVAGTIIEGKIISNGDLRIDGKVTGNIEVSGKMVVGPSGEISGEVKCHNADVSGILNVKIYVKELLYMKSTAKLFGEIYTKKLAIDPGAVFTGSCDMGENEKLNHDKSKELHKRKEAILS